MNSDDNKQNLFALNEIADDICKICLTKFNKNLMAITLAELLCECKTKEEIIQLQHFFTLLSNAVRTYAL